MTEPTEVRMEDWNRLQSEVGRLRILVIIALLAVIALAALAFLRKPDTPNKPDTIIRTQGLVITDAQGRDRILIGAPVPASKDRTRKDDRSDSIIFLSKDGADRVAVGEMPSLHINGKTFKRQNGVENYGMTLYDPKGSERGGMGFLGTGRIAIALDRAAPMEDAIGMMVDDKENYAGLIVKYGDSKTQAPAFELGATGDEVQMQFFGKDNLPHAQLNFGGKGKPAWQFDDDASAAQAAKSQTN